MSRIRQIATAGGTLACAIGIGFVMQNSDAAQKFYRETPAADVPEEIRSSNLLTVEDITLTSGELDTDVTVPGVDAEVIKASVAPELVQPEAPGAAIARKCEISASARPVAAALVNLTMDASCLPNERLTIHHNGMIFSDATNDAGKLDLTIPALSQNAVFIMAFSNGEGAVAQTNVEELADYDRVVLQWKGDTGFQIHAREYGANYGDAGHIWQDAPGETANAITGEGGFITRMGDAAAPEALLAEVYTFPAKTSRAGEVALSVETEVTEINCGLEIEAQTLEIQDGGDLKTRNLTLAVPECDATGNFLVLNNLIQDLKVAAN